MCSDNFISTLPNALIYTIWTSTELYQLWLVLWPVSGQNHCVLIYSGANHCFIWFDIVCEYSLPLPALQLHCLCLKTRDTLFRYSQTLPVENLNFPTLHPWNGVSLLWTPQRWTKIFLATILPFKWIPGINWNHGPITQRALPLYQ